MNFLLDIKLPKSLTEKGVTPINVNKEKWGFLELFETTMNRDLRTGNPWLDPEALNKLKIKIKSRKKRVRFKLKPTIYTIPSPTEDEKQEEQETRWELFLENFQFDSCGSLILVTPASIKG